MTSPLPPLDGNPVAVKPLEWIGLTCPTTIGIYRIKEVSGNFVLTYEAAFPAYYDSLDEAKAAAQADYDQRIRSALVPIAAPVAAGTDEVDGLEIPADLARIMPSVLPENWPAVLESRADAAYLNDTKGTRDLLRVTAVYLRRTAADKAEIARLMANAQTRYIVIDATGCEYVCESREHASDLAKRTFDNAVATRCAAVMAERDGMAEALKPFADFATNRHGEPESSPLDRSLRSTGGMEEFEIRSNFGAGLGSVYADDFRRARNALEAQEAPDKQA